MVLIKDYIKYKFLKRKENKQYGRRNIDID